MPIFPGVASPELKFTPPARKQQQVPQSCRICKRREKTRFSLPGSISGCVHRSRCSDVTAASANEARAPCAGSSTSPSAVRLPPPALPPSRAGAPLRAAQTAELSLSSCLPSHHKSHVRHSPEQQLDQLTAEEREEEEEKRLSACLKLQYDKFGLIYDFYIGEKLDMLPTNTSIKVNTRTTIKVVCVLK